MQRVAAKVGGNYAHTESLQNARKVLLDQINGVLATIAKDVEVEVAFNAARVSSYRLIGYESATRRNGDPSNAGIDGSGIAAGHMVTALYQVVPVRAEVHSAPTAPNAVRGESAVAPSAGAAGDARVGPLLTVKLRHKQPTGGESMTTEHSLDGNVVDWDQAPPDFRFAAAVAQFGMILRDSPHKGNGTLAGVLETAEEAKGADPAGSRAGFVELVRQAQALLARRG
jgi:Ca-activated chloride channel family protein